MFRFEEIHAAVSRKISVIKQGGMVRRGGVITVEAPIAGDNVETSVLVEIADSDSLPPSGELQETQRFGRFEKPAVIIVEDSEWSPVTGEDQFRESVRVEVAENSRADQARLFKTVDLAVSRFEYAAVVPEEVRAGRFRITSGNGPPSDKQVEIAVAVDVGNRHRSDCGKRGEARKQFGLQRGGWRIRSELVKQPGAV